MRGLWANARLRRTSFLRLRQGQGQRLGDMAFYSAFGRQLDRLPGGDDAVTPLLSKSRPEMRLQSCSRFARCADPAKLAGYTCWKALDHGLVRNDRRAEIKMGKATRLQEHQMSFFIHLWLEGEAPPAWRGRVNDGSGGRSKAFEDEQALVSFIRERLLEEYITLPRRGQRVHSRRHCFRMPVQ